MTRGLAFGLSFEVQVARCYLRVSDAMLTKLAMGFRCEGFVRDVRICEGLREGVSGFAPCPFPMKSLESSFPFCARLREVVRFEC